jgi:Ca2+-binding RTX toxin-like protein
MFLEALETRRLFAIIVGTELRVFGTAGNDNLSVSQQDAATLRVEENGVVSFFGDGAVNTIRINVTPAALTTGTAGNDLVQIISTAALPLTEGASIFGGTGTDNLLGGGGGDSIRGENDGDIIRGGEGNDVLDGGEGNNMIFGEGGTDFMFAGLGADQFDGGLGVDTVNYSTRTAGVIVSIDNAANDGQPLIISPGFPISFHPEGDNVWATVENVQGGAGNDVLTAQVGVFTNQLNGLGGNDRLDAGDGNDIILGGDGDDTILGRGANDQLQGNNGNDTIFGGAGNDNITGGAGNDIISGGLGSDSMKGEAGNDIIFAQDGVIDLLIDGGTDFDFVDRDANDPAAIGAEVVV